MSQATGYLVLALSVLIVVARLVSHLRAAYARRRFIRRLHVQSCREVR